MSKRQEIFCFYVLEDEVWLLKLEKHLSGLKKQRLISFWHDRLIAPGINSTQAIDIHLEAASIILLLISADFLASERCSGIQMQRAMERQALGEVQVIPILVRPVDWSGTPFAALQALPTNAEFITSWGNQDAALADVVAGIRRAVEEILRKNPQPSFAQKVRALIHRADLIRKSSIQIGNGSPENDHSHSEISAEMGDELLHTQESRYLEVKSNPYKQGSNFPDIVISYVEEDQNLAEALASALRGRGAVVFYAKYESESERAPQSRRRFFYDDSKTVFEGKARTESLYDYLSEIYRSACYCVVLLSEHYASKVWTDRESQADQTLAFRENQEHILPIQLDDTEFPDNLQAVTYLNWSEETTEAITSCMFLEGSYREPSLKREPLKGYESLKKPDYADKTPLRFITEGTRSIGGDMQVLFSIWNDGPKAVRLFEFFTHEYDNEPVILFSNGPRHILTLVQHGTTLWDGETYEILPGESAPFKLSYSFKENSGTIRSVIGIMARYHSPYGLVQTLHSDAIYILPHWTQSEIDKVQVEHLKRKDPDLYRKILPDLIAHNVIVDFTESHWDLAVIYCTALKYKEALSIFDLLIERDPYNGLLHFYREDALKKMKRWEEARQAYEKGCALGCTWQEYYSHRRSSNIDGRYRY